MFRPFRIARTLARPSPWRLLVLASLVLTFHPGVTAQAQVVHLKGDRAYGSGAVIGIEKHQVGVPKQDLVLTAWHVMKNNTVTIDGHPATLIAKDEKADLALVRVSGLDTAGYFVGTKGIPATGKAVLHGFPGNSYSAEDCSVDEKGDLSIKVRAGGSGGPLVKGHYFVIGVLTRYHGVATRDQIDAFLNSCGYGWLLDISKDYEHLYAAKKSPSPGDQFDANIEEALRLARELLREEREFQEWLRRQREE
ncbi:MAG: serine protease [Gemmataceae bacterium]